MSSTKQTVVVLGASDKPQRFSNKAIKKLQQYGHIVIPVHPRLKEIESVTVAASLNDVPANTVDTLTLYVGPERSIGLADAIVALHPKRVIFNPGTESELLQRKLSEHQIEWVEACTLVMLDTDVF